MSISRTHSRAGFRIGRAFQTKRERRSTGTTSAQTPWDPASSKGVAHYPRWSLPALKYLYEQQKITASGHETTDTDSGIATSKDDYSLETFILSTNHYSDRAC